MKILWTVVSSVVLAAALTACKSSAPAPAEGEPAADAEASAEKAEATKGESTNAKIVAQGAAPSGIPAPSDVAAPPENAERSESGLAWTVLQEGTGDTHPSGAARVAVNYTGWTTDGRMFDSSTKRGKPAEFTVNRVIKGWTEGLQLMVTGEKRRFWIPGELAYGEAKTNDPHAKAGPPRGTLVFDVELIIFQEPPKDVAKIPKNAKKTKSGLGSRVLTKGTGKKHPPAASKVTVHYSGWTTDGQMFDSSVLRGKPATFGLNQLIPGWTEGLQLMVAGEKRRLWIPEDLAYAGQPRKPQGMLVFDVELISFKEMPKPPQTPKDVAKIPKNAKKTKSGLGSRVLTKGTGKEHPTAASKVTVHYSGWTTDGKMFDSSVVRGTPLTLGVTQVIPGWTEGLQLMVVGEKRRLWIPEDLAYAGVSGKPQGMLVFDVELLEIKP